MRSITEFINEASDKKWIAISVVNKNYQGKNVTSERVVTVDTYYNLRNGETKGYQKIVSVTALGPECSTKERAMEFLSPKGTARKSKINKGDADYIVWAINIGKLTPSGKTKFDWNLWDEGENTQNKAKFENDDAEHCIYYDSRWGGCFLWGAKDSLKVGDTIFCVDNDTQKKLAGAPRKIEAIFSATSKADFVEAFRQKFPEMCKRPSRAFGKVSDGLPWSKFGQIYSIKGVAVDA